MIIIYGHVTKKYMSLSFKEIKYIKNLLTFSKYVKKNKSLSPMKMKEVDWQLAL